MSVLESLLYGRDEQPFGKSWEEWTALWWKWLVSIQKDRNPGLNANGAISIMEQPESDVIFLVSNFGGKSERRYTVPAGKAVLFPVINFQTSFAEEPDLKTDEELKSRAKQDMDDIVRKELILDGSSLRNLDHYRVRSEVFDFTYPENNVFDLSPGPTRGISDGFWVFLRPLGPGEHLINSVGACSLGKTMVECIWRITVV